AGTAGEGRAAAAECAAGGPAGGRAPHGQGADELDRPALGQVDGGVQRLGGRAVLPGRRLSDALSRLQGGEHDRAAVPSLSGGPVAAVRAAGTTRAGPGRSAATPPPRRRWTGGRRGTGCGVPTLRRRYAAA